MRTKRVSPLPEALLRTLPLTRPDESRYWPYHLMFLGFVTLIAARSVLTAQMLDDFSPLLFTFYACSFTVVYSAIARYALLRTRFPYDVRAAAPGLFRLGFTTCLAIVSTNLALGRLSPVFHSLIEVSIYPVVASVLTYLFAKGEVVRLKMLIPLFILAIPGIILFSWHDLQGDGLFLSLQGIIFTLLGIFGWASSIVIIANLVRAGTPTIDVLSVRFMVTALVLFPILLFQGEIQWSDQLPTIALIALVAYFFPFILSFIALKKLSVITLALYTMLGPILTYLLVAILWGEWALHMTEILGAGLIFISLALRTRLELRGKARGIQSGYRPEKPVSDKSPNLSNLPIDNPS